MPYFSTNRQQYGIGRQDALSIASGNAATSGSNFFPIDSFEAQNEPETFDVADGMGDRSSLAATVIAQIKSNFSGSILADPDLLGNLLLSVTGQVISTNLGNGAYKHEFTVANNVILPPLTLFYSKGAEAQKRMIGCQLNNLNFEFGDTEGRVSFEGMSLGEDNSGNQAGTVLNLVISSIAFQSNSQLIRYSFSSAPDLSLVKNGDRLTITGATKALNNGIFNIVNIDNTAKWVEVINVDSWSTANDQIGVGGTGNIIRFTPSFYAASLNPMMKWMSELVYSKVDARVDTEFLATGLTINSITVASGITTYTVASGDLSNVLIGDNLIVAGATTTANNGNFIYNVQQAQGGIVEVDNVTKTIKIANSNAVAQAGVGGTLSIKPKTFGVMEFNVDFSNNTEEIFDAANTPNIGVIIQKQVTIESKFTTLNILSHADAARVISDSGLANYRYRFNITNSLIKIGTSQINPKLEIILPKTKASVTRSSDNDDANSLEWELTSVRESNVKFIITNSTPSYT